MRRIVPLVAFLLAFWRFHAVAQSPTPIPIEPLAAATPSPTTSIPGTDPGHPFSAEEKMQLAAKLLAAPALVARAMPQARPRRRVLSITLPGEDETLAPKRSKRRLARMIVFDYTAGRAASLLVDASSAEIISRKTIRGRPQASEEEKQEAIALVKHDRELVQLLNAGAAIEGGFIVDGPRGAPSQNRFIQLQLLSADRARLQRIVTIDLTGRAIVASKAGE